MKNFGTYSIIGFVIGLLLLLTGYVIGRSFTTLNPFTAIVYPLIFSGVLSFIVGLVLGIIGLVNHQQKSLIGFILNLIFIIIVLIAFWMMFSFGSV